MGKKVWDSSKFAAVARRAAAGGIVLLENKIALPLPKDEKIAVFGRCQFNYYKSGTGSGGLVNTEYVTGIWEALEASGLYELNEDVRTAYEEWIKDHPFDLGTGWAAEPWFQEEMPLDERFVRNAAAVSDTAIILIGRTAGEDKDNHNEKGSYLLTDDECDMLQKVCSVFTKSVVLLNTGNIMDMRWVDEIHPDAVAFVWQGGQEGGNGVLDVLSGAVNPSGRLADTIADRIEDYPSTDHFGDREENLYTEDIYVGYRYFSTFDNKAVRYPFGYGLSYTTFRTGGQMDGVINDADGQVTVEVCAENTGNVSGSTVIQVYVGWQPDIQAGGDDLKESDPGDTGKEAARLLGRPSRVLAGFHRTGELGPGESMSVDLEISGYDIASFDDSGITGHRNAYVLERGTYTFYVGENVRDAVPVGSMEITDTIVIRQYEEAMAPSSSFERLESDGSGRKCRGMVPASTLRQEDKRRERLPECISYTGDRGYRLKDVEEGRVSMEDFTAQITDADLCAMIRGEGMNSPKVTAGIAGAYGGVTDGLKELGIPVAGCSDGPSGIRMDCGTHAYSLPNGTCLACSWDEELVKELFSWEGLDLRRNRIDALLGPGMNIHRNPLNGRNFEYFSEDPLLSGRIAAAQLEGMHRWDVTGVIKHFCANSQEINRHRANNVISQRALREIYLKGFEIAVRKGHARAVMTTYGPVNGIWTSSNYDLLTVILRDEWGFDGIVMTDWWAMGNDHAGAPGSYKNTAAQVRAQNDLNMVNANAANNSNGDNLDSSLADGALTRAELVRSAGNILRYLLTTPAWQHFKGVETELDEELKGALSEEDKAILKAIPVDIADERDLPVEQIDCSRGASTLFGITCKERGRYRLELTIRGTGGNRLAQIPMSIFRDKMLLETITLTGADTEWVTREIDIPEGYMYNFNLRFYFAQTGMEIGKARLILTESTEKKYSRP